MNNSSKIKQFLYLSTIVAISVLANSGCVDSHKPPPKPPTEEKFSITGVVQKGNFTELDIAVFALDLTSGTLGEQVATSSSVNSEFEVDLPSSGYYQIQATGTFINEINGQEVTLEQPLLSVVELNGTNTSTNVNLLTHLSALQVISRTEDGTSLSQALMQANEFTQQVFGFDPTIDFTQLDWTKITSATSLGDPELHLLLLSAAIMWDITDFDETLMTNVTTKVMTKGSVLGAPIVFGPYVADFGDFETVDEAVNEFSVLDGVAADSLFETVQPYVEDLPEGIAELDTSDMVLLCISPDPCSWEVIEPREINLNWRSPVRLRSNALHILKESYGNADFVLLLSSASTEDIQVEFTSEEAEAGAERGKDYRSSSQIISIPAGRTQVSVNAPIFIDNYDEEEEDVIYKLNIIGDGYVLGRSSKQIAISSVYGSTGADLDGQVAISSMCLSAMGDGLNIQANGCIDGQLQALPIKDTAALGFDLSLEMTCSQSDTENCSPQSRDWQVEILLEATDQDDLIVAQSSLGHYRYQGSTIPDDNTASKAQTLYTHVDNQFLLLVDKAQDLNWTLNFRAKLTETSQQGLAQLLPQPIQLPEQIIAGDQLVDYQLISLRQIDECNGDSYLITANYSIDNEHFNTSEICVLLDTTPENISGTLTFGVINLANNHLPLPAFHSSHVAYDEDRIQVKGIDYLIIPNPSVVDENGSTYQANELCDLVNCYRGQDLHIETQIQPLSIYLQAEGLPFAFGIYGGTVSRDGIVLAYNKTKYVHAGEFSGSDLRSSGDINSNDIFFKGAGGFDRWGLKNGLSGSLNITQNGINTALNLPESNNGKYAFPQTTLSWPAFPVIIANSTISGMNDLGVTAEMKQVARCTECLSGEANTYKLKGDLTFNNSGVAHAEMTTQINEAFLPSWGQAGANKAFSRDGDMPAGDLSKTANLSLPGYQFSDVENSGLDIFLLGHIEETSDSLLIHSLLTDTAIEGNQWPTGISLGPQFYYQSADGTPDIGTGRSLDDIDLIINNGFDAARALSVNIGTKYVIRNAGITGVFNIDIDPQTPQAIEFYGYQMQFDRFGFRLTDNAHDQYNWIDGSIYIPGKEGETGVGDFTTKFNSLELGCDAKFAASSVAFCGADCEQQRLIAWNANTDIINMEFTSEACSAESQTLSLEQTIEMLALKKPVGLSQVEWQADGLLKSSRLSSSQHHRLDTKEGTYTASGFPFRATSGQLRVVSNGTDLQDYGVLEYSNAAMGIGSFWDMMRTDIRLANASVLAADRSVVLGASKLPAIDDISDDDFNLTNSALATALVDDADAHRYSPYAHYQWGNSKFEFELPVYYDSGSTSKSASYYGRYREKDLLIMKAGAGIDYITPSKTALSFGASAHIPELASLPLRVDLTDYVSLQNVDTLLDDLGVNFSLVSTFDDLQPDLFSILELGNDGLNRAIQGTLDDILTEVGDVALGNGQNLWNEITESMAAIDSLPSQLNVVIGADINVAYEVEVVQKSALLKQQLQQLQTLLTNVQFENTLLSDLTEVQKNGIINIFNTIESIFAQIKDANVRLANELEVIETQAISLVDQAAGTTDQQIDNQLDRLESALTSLNNNLTDVVSLSAYCSAGAGVQQTKAGISSFLEPLQTLSSSIDGATDTFREFANIANLLTGLLNDGSDMLGQLNQMSSRIQEQANNLHVDWTDAKGLLTEQICQHGLSDPEQYLVEVNLLIDPLVAQIGVFRDSLTDIKTVITGNLQISKQLFASQSAATLLMESTFTSAAESLRQGNLDITVADFHTDILASLESLGINVLYADPDIATEFDFHSKIALFTQVQLNWQTEVMSEALSVAQIEFPGSFYTPEEFRSLITNKIMASQAMGALWRTADLYIKTSASEITGIQLSISDFANQAIKEILSETVSPLSDLLASAAAEIPKLPVMAGSIDGHAVIAGSSLESLNIQAEWQTEAQGTDVEGNAFYGAFNAKRYIVREDTPESSCGLPVGISAFDASVFASGPLSLGDSEAPIAEVNLSFTFNESASGLSAYLPLSFDGGFAIVGDMEQDPFVLHNFNFGVGIGRTQAYIGAGGAGSFDSTELSLNAFIGRTCRASIISDMDTEAAPLLNFQDDEPFTGIYGRGSATIPIFGGSCMLDVAARANIGAWITVEPIVKVGGLIGGGLQGSLACLGSVRGEVTTAAETDTAGDTFFAGTAFVVAGAGSCERSKWTSIRRSRKDKWCGTADVGVDVEYRNKKWSYDPKTPSAMH